jgi:hypothetical protein
MIQKQLSQEESRVGTINTEIKIMSGKKETLRSEMENEKKVMADIQESNENMAQSLKEI